MINTLPSVFEEINAPAKKQSKEKTPKSNSKRHNLNSETSHQPEPLTPVEVFQNFCGRRAGIVKALTNDVDNFYRLCDPNKENLCLYGHPNETWEVTLPTEEVPSELPEPTLGINYARDGMDKKDWLSMVAVRSDSWLLAVAFYFGAMFGFNKDARKRLFQMINTLPSIFEEINAPAKIQSKEKTPKSNSKRHKLNSETSHQTESQTKTSGVLPKGEIGYKDEEERVVCGACGNNYAAREFWICCKLCKQWFHGKCVRITPCQGGKY